MTAANETETPGGAVNEAHESARGEPRPPGTGSGGGEPSAELGARGGGRPASPDARRGTPAVEDDEVLPRKGRRSVLVTALVAAIVLGAFVLLLVGAKEPDSRSQVVGKPAPSADLSFDTVATTDEKVALADFRGRYVVLNFFASWCVPCEQEHPQLVRFQQKHAALGDATVVQVLYNDKPEAARRFFQERGEGGWPVLIDDRGQFALDYGVTGPPTTFLIDPRGNVLAGVKGAIDDARLDDLVARAKAGRP